MKNNFNELAESARSANLADYFLQSGYTTERHGAEIYIKEFSGLCVNSNTGNWYYHYGNIGGRNAVDCLVNVCGHDFKQAVYALTGNDITSSRSTAYPKNERPQYTYPPKSAPKEKPVKELKMPERAGNMRRVFAYLCKERKIPAAIVEELAHAKLLYQSEQEIKTTVNDIPQTCKTSNAVFVHKNENGDVIGGEVQGVNSYKRYKGVVEGTGTSVFSYTPFPAKDNKIKTAYLFESAIDLMSFYAFCKPEKMTGVTLISMGGLKPIMPKQLEAQGVKVISCVDNDDEGRKFESVNGFKRTNDMLEKAGVKDWNQLLVMKTENPEEVKNITPDIEKKHLFARRK